MPLPSSSQHLVAGDDMLVRALREGDEATFARLVDAWGPLMLRMAQVHVPSRAAAEEAFRRRGRACSVTSINSSGGRRYARGCSALS